MSKGIVTGKRLAEIGEEVVAEAGQIKDLIVDAYTDGIKTAKTATERAFKRGHNAAEELLDNASHQVKRHPFESVGITLGVGLAVGVAVGWLATRKRS